METEDIGTNIKSIKFDVNGFISEDVLKVIDNMDLNNIVSVVIVNKNSTTETINLVDGDKIMFYENEIVHRVKEGNHLWHIYIMGLKSIIINYHE